MEKIKELTEDQLKEITKEGRTVLEFSADWCPDCKFLAPFMPEIEKDFSDAKFYEIDRDGSIDISPYSSTASARHSSARRARACSGRWSARA